MIVYGINGTTLATGRLEGGVCLKCKTADSVVMVARSEHFHVFWVPMFPVFKSGGTICESCGHTVKDAKLPEKYKPVLKSLKKSRMAPLWQFSGLFIVAIALTYFSVSARLDNKENTNIIDLLNNPVVGDKYECKVEMGRYSIWKVIRIESDLVYVRYNAYSTERKSELSDIDIDENYTDLEFNWLKESLVNHYKAGKLIGVIRER